MHVTQFTAGEKCTAAMVSPLGTGEAFGPAISVGYYTKETEEIWIDGECGRLNIQIADLPAFIKELKRAAKIAGEQS